LHLNAVAGGVLGTFNEMAGRFLKGRQQAIAKIDHLNVQLGKQDMLSVLKRKGWNVEKKKELGNLDLGQQVGEAFFQRQCGNAWNLDINGVTNGIDLFVGLGDLMERFEFDYCGLVGGAWAEWGKRVRRPKV
jgi:hypothetical protein